MVKAGGFTVPGSVVKITMQDFMTYINETIWPGPAFNVTVRQIDLQLCRATLLYH